MSLTEKQKQELEKHKEELRRTIFPSILSNPFVRNGQVDAEELWEMEWEKAKRNLSLYYENLSLHYEDVNRREQGNL